MEIYKRYKCANGTEYIRFFTRCFTVDDVIAFLEPHRGKKIYTDAFENPCLEIGDKLIQFEEVWYFTLDYVLADNQKLADDMDKFFNHECGRVAYETDRLGNGCDKKDGNDNEQLSIDGFFDKEGDE